jgi:hypothetical protein
MNYEIRGVFRDVNDALRYQVRYECGDEGEDLYEEELGHEDMFGFIESSVLLDG